MGSVKRPLRGLWVAYRSRRKLGCRPYSGVERPRAKIQELNGGKPFPSTTSVFVEDLEIAEVETNDLLGREVTISKSDYSAAKGNVIKVSEQKIMLDLSKGIKGVETNIWVTILDANGKEHRGTLYVDMQATH